jgi:hypothetical protein
MKVKSRYQNSTNRFLEVNTKKNKEDSRNHDVERPSRTTLVLVRPADDKDDSEDQQHDRQEEEELSVISASSSCSSSDSYYDEDESRSPASYISTPKIANDYDHHSSLGSFSVSVLGSRPIDFIDEQGNLPLTKVSPILPAVAEEQEEDEEDEKDGDLLIQLTPPTKICHGTKKGDEEDDTLSTAGSFTECTTNSSSTKLLVVDTPANLTRNISEIHFDSSTPHEQRKPNDVSSTTANSCQNDVQMKRVILIMKDVIFRQRSVMKNISKEKVTLQKKCDFYKLQNKSLSRANKQMTKEMNRVHKTNEALEQELEKLRTELNEVLRWK